MDSLFVEGLAATISSIIVFCGSVWLLLALVLGPRLAYFVSASITLGFLLMMGGVWSIGEPLGPVGELPSYALVGAGDTPDEVQFGPASEFPDGGGWVEAGEDEALAEIKTGAESAAGEELEAAIEEGTITTFEQLADATVDADATRVLDQGGTLYTMVRFEAIPAVPEEGDDPSDQDITPEKGDNPSEDDAAAEEEEVPGSDAEAFLVLEQDPGDPSGEARMITGAFLILFVAHLFGLSWSEKRARRASAAT